MKIRTDYVSNSSSSSFVVVLPKDYKQEDFISDVVKACSDEKDYDYEKEFVENLDKFNRRQLDFCMNSYELLFIGELNVGTIHGTVDGEAEVEQFMRAVKCMEKENSPRTPTITSQTKDHLEYDEPDLAEGITVSTQAMSWTVRPHRWKDDKDEDYTGKVVDSIMKISSWDNRNNIFTYDDCMGICEVSKNTILNTVDLISHGKEVKLPKWASDLDALLKRLESGDRIYCINMNQGGDGQDLGSIYALNGWDSDFNKYANVEVLQSECG